MTKTVIRFFLVMFFCTPMYGQLYYGAGAFLNQGMSARGLGLGGACIAKVSDPSSVYWNPAGVVNRRGINVQVSDLKNTQFYTTFDDVNYPQFAITYSPPKASFTYFHWGLGLGGSAFFVKGIDEYDEQSNYVRSFSFGEYTLFLSLALETQNFRLGISYKYLEQNVGGFHNSSDLRDNKKGVDLGLQFRPVSFLSFGISIRDRMKIGSYDVIPRTVTTGVAFSSERLELAVDYQISESSFSRINSGMEIRLGKNYEWEIRMGIKDIPLSDRSLPDKLWKMNSKGSLGFGYTWEFEKVIHGIALDVAIQQEIYPTFLSPFSRIVATTITLF